MAEYWTTQGTSIEITEETGMLYDRLWYYRHLGFLLLPLILYAIPYSGHPLSPLLSIPQSVENIERVLITLRLMERTRLAGARSPAIRERVTEWSERERMLSEWGYEDAQLVEEARKAGIETSIDADVEQASKMALLQAFSIGLGAPIPQPQQ